MGRPRSARRGHCARACFRRAGRAAQSVAQPLLQCAAGKGLERLHPRNHRLHRARHDLRRDRGLSALSEPVAPDSLAQLADHQISRRVAARRQSLPHAVAGRCGRQPRPAHLRRHQDVRRANAGRGPHPAELHRDVRLLRDDPVGAVERGAVASVRRRLDDSRLSGLGRADLLDLRHRADAVDRRPARQSRFRAAAPRGRFPLQPGARARKLRADRSAGGRSGGARTAARTALAASSPTGTPS